MPLYDFECLKCSNVFEVSCKICERDDTKPCPGCKSTKTELRFFVASKTADAFTLGVNQRQKDFKEVLNKVHKRTAGSQLDKTTNI